MGTVSKTPNTSRRQFLKGAAAVPAIGLATKASAQTAEPSARAVPAVPQTAGDTLPPTASAKIVTEHKVGGDFMVDCLQALDIDYVASCPGSTFRGLHESIINYGDNKKPEFITTLHEDTAAVMCHGYYKVAKKPMACMVHGTVGLQHASMAIYNAFADRVPMLILSGNIGKPETRQAYIEWNHAAQDQAATVRDITKWDDQPNSLQGFAESTVRAYDLMTTAPMAPEPLRRRNHFDMLLERRSRADLLTVLDERMEVGLKKPGAIEFAQAFDEALRLRGSKGH